MRSLLLQQAVLCTHFTLLEEEEERFLGLLLRDDDAEEELRVLRRVRMLRRACSEDAPPTADCGADRCFALDDDEEEEEAAAAAFAETDLVRCSTFLGSSRSESDMGASLLLDELRLLWCRILRLRLVR